MTTFKEACDQLIKATEGTQLQVTFDGYAGEVQIHWYGVIKLNCGAAGAAKALGLFKQLEALGAKDC